MMKSLTRACLGLLLAAAWIPSPASAQSAPNTWRNVAIVGGGFTPGIIFNATEPGLVYARTDIGGAYRFDNATKRWIPLTDFVGFDDATLTGVDTLATDPVDPDRLYVVAGQFTNEWMQQNGEVFRSRDRGKTFERIVLPFKTGGNFPGRSMGERLAIDPNQNSILFMGARSGNGLFRSDDFGSTWQKVTSFPTGGTYFESDLNSVTRDLIGVVWVTFDPRTGTPGSPTQTLYVGVADKGLSVFRSRDGGKTWEAVPGQPTGFLPHHGVLAPQTGMLYIPYSNGAGPFDGNKGDVFKLDTATGVWTNISPVPSTSDNNFFGYGGLSVDAQNPDTLMTTALNSFFPDTMIFRSTDAGKTWTPIYEFTAFPDRLLRYTQDISVAPWLTFARQPNPPIPSPQLGFLVGDIEIDPFDPDRFLYVTGATIFGTKNASDWDRGGKVAIDVQAAGIEETAVLDLISPPVGPPLISALGDLGGFRHDDLDQVPQSIFTSPIFTTGTGVDFAELAPNIVVRVGTGDQARFGISTDIGATWTPGKDPQGTSGGGSVAISADGSSALWSLQDVGVQVSSDRGQTWTRSAGIPTGAQIASDRVRGSKFYGFLGGKVFRSTDGGLSFIATGAAGLPGSGKIKAMPGVEGELWLAGESGGLFRSADGGDTFQRTAGVEKADTIGFGKAAPGQKTLALFSSAQVGGVRGIYESDDGGVTWLRLNDDLHQFGFTGQEITGDPRVYGRVYVSTNGRGIMIGERGKDAPAPAPAAPAPDAGGNPGAGTPPPVMNPAAPSNPVPRPPRRRGFRFRRR